MERKAVEKAQQRFQLAKSQLERARDATDFESFQGYWYLFLISAKNVYTVLEQGSKDTAQCRQWFGGIKAQRRSDPLLQYLFQARDSDEHALEQVAEQVQPSVNIFAAPTGYSRSFHIELIRNDGFRPIVEGVTSFDGKPVPIGTSPGYAKLARVRGRGDVFYDPPEFHLGEKISSNLPIPVGELALAFLERLIEDAAARCAP